MASICARSLRRSRTQRRRRLVWYIFSAGTQALGLRSGGMVMPYSQPWGEGDTWVKAGEEPPHLASHQGPLFTYTQIGTALIAKLCPDTTRFPSLLVHADNDLLVLLPNGGVPLGMPR